MTNFLKTIKAMCDCRLRRFLLVIICFVYYGNSIAAVETGQIVRVINDLRLYGTNIVCTKITRPAHPRLNSDLCRNTDGGLGVTSTGYGAPQFVDFCKSDKGWVPQINHINSSLSSNGNFRMILNNGSTESDRRDNGLTTTTSSLIQQSTFNFTITLEESGTSALATAGRTRNDRSKVLAVLNSNGKIDSDFTHSEVERRVGLGKLSASIQTGTCEPTPLPLRAILLTTYFDGKNQSVETSIRRLNLANGLIADGISRGLIVVPLPDDSFRNKVDILLNSSLGGLYKCTSNCATNTFAGSGSDRLSKLPLIKVDDRWFAYAFYKAPEAQDADFRTSTTQSLGKNIRIDILAKSDVLVLPFKLLAPPILAIHGVWSKGDVWLEFINHLNSIGYPAVNKSIVDYKQYNAQRFDAQDIQDILYGQISERLESARNHGFIATQVDVVGHSMGGLVTKYFSGRALDKKMFSFGQGAVNRLITVNTPHAGSPLAEKFFDLKDNFPIDPVYPNNIKRMIGGIPTLKNFVSLFALDITGSAMQSLSPGNKLLSVSTNLQYTSIYSTAIGPDVLNKHPLESLFDLVLKIYDPLSLLEDPIDELLNIPKAPTLLPENHDTIVSVHSQILGSANTPILFRNLTHIEMTENKGVHQTIVCLFLGRTGCGPSNIISPLNQTQLNQKKIQAAGSTHLLTTDLTTLTEVNTDHIKITPALGSILTINDPTELSFEGVNKTVKNILLIKNSSPYDGNSIVEIKQAPFENTFTPTKIGNEKFRITVFFDDDSYLITDLNYPTKFSGEFSGIEYESEINLNVNGPSFPLKATAFFENTTLGVDVTKDITIENSTLRPDIVDVTSDGYITPIKEGVALINIKYQSKDFPALVIVSKGTNDIGVNNDDCSFFVLPNKNGGSTVICL